MEEVKTVKRESERNWGETRVNRRHSLSGSRQFCVKVCSLVDLCFLLQNHRDFIRFNTGILSFRFVESTKPAPFPSGGSQAASISHVARAANSKTTGELYIKWPHGEACLLFSLTVFWSLKTFDLQTVCLCSTRMLVHSAFMQMSRLDAKPHPAKE